MTTATASKETVAPAGNVTPMRKTLKAVAAAMADQAPPLAPTIPALSPLSAYLADETRRHRDAVGEKRFLESQIERLDAAYAERCGMLRARHERELTDEARKHESERFALTAHIAEQASIIAGAEAALAASPPLESVSATMGAPD